MDGIHEPVMLESQVMAGGSDETTSTSLMPSTASSSMIMTDTSLDSTDSCSYNPLSSFSYQSSKETVLSNTSNTMSSLFTSLAVSSPSEGNQVLSSFSTKEDVDSSSQVLQAYENNSSSLSSSAQQLHFMKGNHSHHSEQPKKEEEEEEEEEERRRQDNNKSQDNEKGNNAVDVTKVGDDRTSSLNKHSLQNPCCSTSATESSLTAMTDLRGLNLPSSQYHPNHPLQVKPCPPVTTEKEHLNTIILKKISTDVIRDMNDYGLCVIDNFLSSLGMSYRSECLLKEVHDLYSTPHVFREGGLVNDLLRASISVRGDRIVWVNGSEPKCFNIGFLIRTLDTIISLCSSSSNVIQDCNIKSRTKAMVACYPGEGSQYVKHIDNPNGDGRCITCIYYLNKDWDVNLHGGLLRLFPQGTNQVANIQPVFDRLIFFWSDRRNPHEVQRAFNVRFAITVWYFNQDERLEHLRKKANGRQIVPDPLLWPLLK